MATESRPPPPFPLSDLGPCELSWFHTSDDLFFWIKRWVFWSGDDDELRHHHRSPLPLASNDGDPTMKEKIKCALQKLCPNLLDAFLIQFWGLVNIGGRMYLTTCDQPFALYDHLGDCQEFAGGCRRYRKHCLGCLIAVDETNVEEGELGPPGRVFRSGLPELIVDASHYSSEEYPQRDLAVKNLKSYSAFPVYQSPGRICIGVLEFVSQKYRHSDLWGSLVDSLKEVNLTTHCPVQLFNYEQSSSCHKTEIDKIVEVLKMICKTLRLPVAQTWIEADSKEQLTTMFEGSYYEQYAIQFENSCCFIRKGHGVVGKAFSIQSACFCRDIRQLSLTECPFAVNARQFRFSSCFAICLQSSCLNCCIYTLEFLLPDKINSGDPRTTLLLLMIMEILKLHLQRYFKIASGQELGQNLFVKVIKVSSDDKLDSFEICHPSSGESTPRVVEVHNQVGIIPPDGSSQQVYAANNSVHDISVQQNVIVESPPIPELVQNVLTVTHNDSEASHLRKRGLVYTLESARGITLKDLQERSTMKLVDAAEDLGVSRSTLKRICRRYDVSRWPPHKARKCNQAIDELELAQPSKKNIEAHPMSIATGLLDDSNIMVKATYGDDRIKFQLLLSARKTDLEDKVAKGFNLPVGSFRIKFLDEDNEWILVTCDEDLSISLRMLRSLGKTTVRMLVSQ